MASHNLEWVFSIKDKVSSGLKGIQKNVKQFNNDIKTVSSSAKALPVTIDQLREKITTLNAQKGTATSKAEIIKINAELDRTNKKLRSLENLPPRGLFQNLNKLSSSILGISLKDIGGVYAVMQVKNLATESVKLYDVQKQAEGQLRASLISTRNTAGKTFKELTEMAAGLQKKTTFGDEEIIKAQSLLLTFKGVGGAIYDKAIPAILDLSTKMGQDLQSSTIQIGKALQDPIMGMSTLRRVGIQLSDQQQAQVKKLVESGHMQQAQMVILNELNSEFGGSSEMAAKAGLGAMKQLHNMWGDIKEKIGGAVLAELNLIMPKLKRLVEWIDENRHSLFNLAKVVGIATAVYVAFKLALDIRSTIIGTVGMISSLATHIATFAKIVAVVGKTMLISIRTICTGISTAIGSIPIIGWIAIAIAAIAGLLAYFWNTSAKFRAVIKGSWAYVKNIVVEIWNTIKNVFSAIGDIIHSAITLDFSGVKAAAKRLSSTFTDFGKQSAQAYTKAYNEEMARSGKSAPKTTKSSSPKQSQRQSITQPLQPLELKTQTNNQNTSSQEEKNKSDNSNAGSKGTGTIITNIHNLIGGDIVVHTTNLKEGAAEIKRIVVEALMDATNQRAYE
jgi:Phage-related protein